MSEVNVNKNSTYEELEPGGTICNAANSLHFKTGDWRSVRPIFLEDNCKQCGLCFPVCPDNAIPVGDDLKRKDFNYDYCKGCGVCAKTCPFNAIEMKEEGKI